MSNEEKLPDLVNTQVQVCLTVCVGLNIGDTDMALRQIQKEAERAAVDALVSVLYRGKKHVGCGPALTAEFKIVGRPVVEVLAFKRKGEP